MSHERSHLFCPDSAPIEGVLENVAGVHPLDPSLEKSACVPMRRVDTFRATHESELDTETGRAIGHDFARLGMPLPEDAYKAVVEGYHYGKHAHNGSRSDGIIRQASDPGVRKLVRLRYSAWKRNRIVDESVTPEFLNVIQVDHCPITRVKLTHGTKLDTDATIDRVYNHGAYAIGNLAVLSARANAAKANRLPDEILEIAKSEKPLDGLEPIEWKRMATLCMVGSPIDRFELWPLHVIPPQGMVMSAQPLIMEFMSMMSFCLVPPAFFNLARNVFDGKKEKRTLMDFIAAFGGRNHRMPEVRGIERIHRMEDFWGDPLLWGCYLKVHKNLTPTKRAALYQLAQKAIFGKVLPPIGKMTIERNWHLQTHGYVIPNE